MTARANGSHGTNGTLQGQHLHLEPTSGIAGDMAVAALVDAGVPAKVVTAAIASMGVPGLRTRFERRTRGAYVGRGFVVRYPGMNHGHEREHVHVDVDEHEHVHDHGHDHVHGHEHVHDQNHRRAPHAPHRDYREIRRLLRRAELEPDVRALAGDIFARLAEVEAALHDMPIDRVAFHEVGAFDSIADIVGVAAAIVWLAPASIGSGPPVVGSGQVRIAHGRVMVPAPATAALLRGIPILSEGEGELTTPTGAAILAAVVDRFGPPPPMRVRAIGYGAGTRELSDRPNVLRVLIGEPLGQAETSPPPAPTVVVVEANIDDMSPELVSPLFEALLAAGAVDVWSTPILMKKGRPAITVSAMAPPALVSDVERAFFRSSTTIGVRRYGADRTVLQRSLVAVDTAYGSVRVKLGAVGGEVIGAQPEFEDCRRRAAATGAAVREVMSAAAAAGRALLSGTGGPTRAPAAARRAPRGKRARR